MIRAVAVFVAYLLCAVHSAALPVAAASLQYEPSVVELSGTVVLEEHYGPPGFGEDPRTDAVELIAVLVLDAPISVEGDADPQSLNQSSHMDVSRVQMVRTYADPPFAPYAGKHVVVSGALYEGHTGHHHTDVLITVERIAVR
jgi:hypothetical protein